MTINYDYDKHTKTYVCQACGYKYVEDTSTSYRRAIEGDDEFIEMEGLELHSTDRGGWYPSHHTHTIYACPKCGVLQIQT